MTIAVANTSNSATFQFWLDRTNELATAMSNKVITVQSNTTTGNATVNGIFTAATLTANTLRGGNTTTSASLSVSSNLVINTAAYLIVGDAATCTTISSSTLLIGNSTVNTIANSSCVRVSTVSVGNSAQNLVTNSTSLAVNGIVVALPLTINIQTTGTESQVLDYFRAAEYLITVTNNNANGYQMNKLNVIHDGGTGLISDYGMLVTNNQLATFNATVNATSCILSVTPSSTNTQIKGTKVLVSI
jgi:hypothetical protein